MTIPADNVSIRSFISFLVYSNLIIAISVSSATLLAFFLLQYPVIWEVMLVVFSGTLSIYTLNRFTDIQEDSINLPGRVEFIRKYGKIILLIAILLYTGSLVMVALHSAMAGIVALLPPAIAVLYSCFRLKRFFLVKNILISAGFVCSVLIVGAYYHEFSISIALLTVLLFTAGFVNSIIFDIKDLQGDKLCNIQTFPAKYGFRKTKYYCYLLLLPVFLITFYFIMNHIRSAILLPFLGYIASYTYFLKDTEQYPDWYFGLYVDGEYIVLLFFIIIFSLAGVFTLP